MIRGRLEKVTVTSMTAVSGGGHLGPKIVRAKMIIGGVVMEGDCEFTFSADLGASAVLSPVSVNDAIAAAELAFADV